MTAIRIRVLTTDPSVLTHLLGGAARPGGCYELADGAALTVETHSSKRGWGEPEVVDGVLTFGPEVSPRQVADWLVKRLARRKVRLEIAGRVVPPDDLPAVAAALGPEST